MEEQDQQYITDNFSRIADICAKIQAEIAVEVTKEQPELLEWANELASGPEEKVMEAMNRQLSNLINATPLACLYGTNLITTLISIHSELTGDQTIINAIRKNNDEHHQM